MTYDEIVAMLEETGFPLAYDHFEEGASPDPPFLVFLFPRSNNFIADGRVYRKIDELHIELYTDRKQPDMEAAVEGVLDGHGHAYEKSEVWIPDEKLYEVLYTLEVIKNVEE
ncbi:MAG: hypothetical protein IJT77_07255 [Clostridia bacterium]|nr:hypothetical protein [Clostridia bacterium]